MPEARERAALEVLRSVEWSSGDCGGECPVCDAWSGDGHAPDCALAAALATPTLDGGEVRHMIVTGRPNPIVAALSGTPQVEGEAGQIKPGDVLNCSSCGGRRKWGVACVLCGWVTDDEKLLLAALRSAPSVAEEGERVVAIRTLRGERGEPRPDVPPVAEVETWDSRGENREWGYTIHMLEEEQIAALPEGQYPIYLAAPVPAREGEDGAGLIAAERRRQIETEGWMPEHDDMHDYGEMVGAAICYAAHALDPVIIPDHGLMQLWPEDWSWKPKGDEFRDLVRAGALIAAEIDRRLRAARLRGEGGGDA